MALRKGQRVPIAVLDQEIYANSKEIFRFSMERKDTTTYFHDLEDQARSFERTGCKVFFVFIDPVKYVAWCEAKEIKTDAGKSRTKYAEEALASGRALPYNSKQGLWTMGVWSIANRTRLNSMPTVVDKDAIEDAKYTAKYLMETAEKNLTGNSRYLATACRTSQFDEDDLWQHFSGALASGDNLVIEDGYISSADGGDVSEEISISRSPWWIESPLMPVLMLGALGHGFVAAVSCETPSSVPQVFEIGPHGWREVPSVTVTERLTTLSN